MTVALLDAAGDRPPFGVYSVRDIRSLGYDRPAIDRGLRRGDVRRLRHGVYALGPAPDDLDERHRELTAAALLTIGPRAIASHGSAALLRDLPLLGGRDTVAVTVARATHRVYDGLSVHVANLAAADRTIHRGLPVTSTGRTLVDLTRTHGPRAGLVAADSAWRQAAHRGSTAAFVADWDRAIDAARGRPGVVDARWVREHADSRAESPLESLLRVVCRAAGIVLDLQVPVAASGVWHRLDAVVRGTRVAIECDGRLKYRESTLQFAATVDDRLWEDRQRDCRLSEAGWFVVHVKWDQVMRTPDAVVRRIHEALARAARDPRPATS